MSEHTLRELAPAGSRWRFKYGPRDVLVSTGIYADWRNASEWTEGVKIVPVVGLQSESNASDWGTVREVDLRDAYERIDT